MFKVIQTEYEANENGFIYNIFERNGITLYRREESKPNVPPCKEVYTSDGWVPLLSYDGAPYKFSSIKELRKFIKAQALTESTK